MSSDAATAAPITVDPELEPGKLIPAFLRRYARRYAVVYAFGLAFLVATNWLTVTIPSLIKDVFDALAAGSDPGVIRTTCALIASAAVAVIIVRTLSRVLFFNPGRTIEYRVRNDMLERILSMSQTWLRGRQTGDLVSRAVNDATFVRALVGFAVLQLLNVLLASSLALWKMAVTDAWLTIYCMIPLGISFFVLRRGTRRLFFSYRESQEELGKVSEHILETYNGVAAIQGMAAEEAFLRRFDERNDHYTHLNLKVTVLRVFILPLASSMGHVCVFLLLLIGGQHAIEGSLTIGDVAAYASYTGILVAGLAMSGWLLNSVQRGFVALQRCWDVIRLETDRPEGTTKIATDGRGIALRINGLTFGYPDAEAGERDALTGIDLDLSPGESMGVYGEVGSGKTTLVQVLTGLLPPPAGTVFVDGHDVAAIDEDTLRGAIAVVPQSAFLFSRTLRRNVALVDGEAEIDDERVSAAVAKACLEHDVTRLENGLETVVGERGLTLSGGQRQRAQLARAFYRGYRLLVLDDVLSAVDHGTEEKLLEAISGELRNADRPSSIIVSSRISALAACDKTVVLDAGRVVDVGTHAALIDRPGPYQRAHLAQLDTDEREQDIRHAG